MPTFALQAKRRTIFVMVSLSVLVLALVVRLFDLQVVRHHFLVEQARNRIWVEIPLRARRGRLYDRVGRPLALNEKGYVLWVDADHLDGSRESMALLAQLAEQQRPEDVRLILAGEEEGFFYWSRWVDPRYAERIQEMKADPEEPLTGVILEVEPRRTYPYGRLLAPVLGYLQDEGPPDAREVTDYRAFGGVEGYYDALLSGKDGWIRMEQDKQYAMIPIGPHEKEAPVDGANLTLTLDLNVQYMAERLISEAVDDADARSGDILVLDPNTGAILAMASYPSFDPGRIAECAADPKCREVLYTNPIFGRQYEPGSTFKILTMAIALEEHVVRPDDGFECTGVTMVGDQTFRNWDGAAHGYETMSEILLHSCNIGAVYLSQRVGPEAFYRYVDRLGFGRLTGVDLAGEVGGQVRWHDSEWWALSDLAANSFGQAIAVTPLQLAAAVGAVANGGELMKPYIVQAIERDGVVTETLPTLRASVFHPEVCADVSAMLADVGAIKSEEGGPVVPGYEVALKTGTAQIPLPGQGYEPHRTIASAIGYAPAQEPRFLILVRIEGNRVLWGTEVAVPVFADMAQFLLGYLHVPPVGEGETVGR